jgi:hypothetical protein
MSDARGGTEIPLVYSNYLLVIGFSSEPNSPFLITTVNTAMMERYSRESVFSRSMVTQFSDHLGCNDLNEESRIRMRNRLSARQPDPYILKILQENILDSI